jgi:hypothetical protein
MQRVYVGQEDVGRRHRPAVTTNAQDDDEDTPRFVSYYTARKMQYIQCVYIAVSTDDNAERRTPSVE